MNTEQTSKNIFTYISNSKQDAGGDLSVCVLNLLESNMFWNVSQQLLKFNVMESLSGYFFILTLRENRLLYKYQVLVIYWQIFMVRAFL